MLQDGAAAGKPEGDRIGGGDPLKGKKIWVHAMAYGSARAFVAGFRAIGLDAEITPPSDGRTLELGARHTSGDECYPAKVTVGDYMRLLENPSTDLDRTVLFMPTAEGPCRFGLYAPYLRQILDANGYQRVPLLQASSKNAYQGLGNLTTAFLRTGWRALVAGDIVTKLLLKCRPYEIVKGEADRVFEESLNDVCGTIETTTTEPAAQLKAIRQSLVRSRDRFRRIPIRQDRTTPLIGVVGEIFCRLNTFSNEDLIRRVEEYGAETWLSDIAEWVWYTKSEQFRKLRLEGRIVSREAFEAWIRKYVQKRDEHVLMEPFKEDFLGCEEPPIEVILDCARPYLPQDGALGEMVLNVGKVVYLAQKGADGVIDISPFTCMNGIVSEAIYPRISRDMGGIPIRNFYFDGTQSDLDRDLGVYLELARSYQKRKKHQRVYAGVPAA
jgi:predicted nucleotide-binding protein (sugar kinase/HSP70/actin superfamily)